MSKQDQKITELEAEITRLKAAVNELKILNEIAVLSGKATNIDQILHLMIEKSINAVGAEQASILLVTSNKRKPFKTIIRQDDTSSLKHDYHIGTSLTGWVMLNKESLIIEDLQKDKRFEPSEEEKKDIHSVLCVPIWFEGKITGIMMLINKKNQRSFSQNDLTLISIISIQAGQLINNLRLQQETLQKEKEAEKLQEIDKIKTNFFTNISHEFRTPLTLILGPAQKILEQSGNDEINEEARLIHQNAKKLNRLTNQLLDLSRIEAGKMKLKTSKQNILPLLNEIAASFQPFADRKKISLKCQSGQEEIRIYIDRDKIDKIITNILSNALKFTPEGGCVNVNVKTRPLLDENYAFDSQVKEIAEISVQDNGIGIPEEQLDKIFDRFYQLDNRLSREYDGTGVGLSLTKELVELHKGRILVESEQGKGSIFRVILPMGKEHLLEEEIIDVDTLDKSEEISGGDARVQDIKNAAPLIIKNKFDINSISKESPTLLIIEDNEDVRRYVKGILNDLYIIKEASDGEEGLEKALDMIPDLIISDIMMPKRDGMQLCHNIKSDSRTSHIPVILLTAKTTLKDKIEGLETGADDYLTKPFEADELKARIRGLLDQRKRMQEYFRQHELFGEEIKVITSSDKKFLTDTVKIIKENISDPALSVELLARNLAVSRQLLYKKLISLVGESPNEFIRRIRLNRAQKLIESKSGNISEIALEVGFGNPSYFAECFQKQFGVLPSQYHQKSPAP
ncbi:MAG TPA: ATP-binding protein [Ignavibacteriaceae bacterium]|nr:ATP-binding protein [Ignavibacteriaceae bacterium]